MLQAEPNNIPMQTLLASLASLVVGESMRTLAIKKRMPNVCPVQLVTTLRTPNLRSARSADRDRLRLILRRIPQNTARIAKWGSTKRVDLEHVAHVELGR